MVTLASGKMAKSLGNILDVERAVELHGRNALRMWILQSHYSQPIDYSEEILEEKKRAFERLLRLYRRLSDSERSSEFSENLAAELRDRFDMAMRDDLNTPEVIAALFEAASGAGQELSARPEGVREFASFRDALEETLNTLGFDLAEESASTVDGVRVRYEEKPEDKVLRRVVGREQARREKDWVSADRLRDELKAEGWAVEDTPEGPVVNRW